MLTTVSHNKEKGLKVVKHSNPRGRSTILEYQVHDTKDTMNPLRERFSTKAEADAFIGVERMSPTPKSKRSK